MKSIFHKEAIDSIKPLCRATLRPIDRQIFDTTTVISAWVNCPGCIAIEETLREIEQDAYWIEA